MLLRILEIRFVTNYGNQKTNDINSEKGVDCAAYGTTYNIFQSGSYMAIKVKPFVAEKEIAET